MFHISISIHFPLMFRRLFFQKSAESTLKDLLNWLQRVQRQIDEKSAETINLSNIDTELEDVRVSTSCFSNEQSWQLCLYFKKTRDLGNDCELESHITLPKKIF